MMISLLNKYRRPVKCAFRLLVYQAVLLLLWGSATHLHAQPDEIWFDNPSAYGEKQRSAVFFNHDGHMENHECLECHHDYNNGRNVLDESDIEEDGRNTCIQCHRDDASINLKNAFHRQCIGCHRSYNKENKVPVPLPVTCAACHPKSGR
jgi:class III cytochrome C family protein